MSKIRSKLIQSIFQRIKLDPYDFEAIAIRALYFLAINDYENASLDIAKFPNYGYELSFISTANKVMEGNQKIVYRNGIFFITQSEVEEEILNLIIKLTLNSSLEMKKILNCTSPLLIMDLSFDKNFSMTVEQIPKICHIFIAENDLNSSAFSAILMHEIAHAFLKFDNRFLDEGWACYIQYNYTDSSQFPVEKKDIVPFLSRYQTKLLPLTSLLDLDASSDVYFQAFTENSEQRTLVYLLGYAFVSYWVGEFGIEGIKHLFSKSTGKNKREKDIVYLAESIAGISIMQLEYLTLTSLGITPHVYDKKNEEKLVKDANVAYLKQNTSFYFNHIGKCRLSMLAKMTVESQLVYLKLVSDFSLIQLKKNMSVNSLILNDALQVADKLIALPNINVEAFRWAGQIACASLKATLDPTKRLRFLVKARKYLSYSLNIQGDRPEILILLLTMELNSPTEHRDDLNIIEGYIKRLSIFDDYDTNIQYYNTKFRV